MILMDTGLKRLVTIDYTNWKGNRRKRQVLPVEIVFAKTSYHPEVQWLLVAWDIEDMEQRTFAIKDIHSWEPPNDSTS